MLVQNNDNFNEFNNLNSNLNSNNLSLNINNIHQNAEGDIP